MRHHRYKYAGRRPYRVDRTRPPRHPDAMKRAKDWDRLSAYALSWRKRLKLRREDVAARGETSPKTIERIENGEPVRPTSLAALEIGLDWEPGSARAVLDGGEPTPLGGKVVKPVGEMTRAEAVDRAEEIVQETGDEQKGEDFIRRWAEARHAETRKAVPHDAL